MGSSCSRTVVDVIPDRDVMISVVDTIVGFEEMLKKGEPLSKSEERELRQCKRVTSELKKINLKACKKRGRGEL